MKRPFRLFVARQRESADVVVASQGCGCRRHHRRILTGEVFGRWGLCGHEDKLDLQQPTPMFMLSICITRLVVSSQLHMCSCESGIEVFVALNKTFSTRRMIYFEQSVIEHRSCTLTVLTKPFCQTFVSFHPFLAFAFLSIFSSSGINLALVICLLSFFSLLLQKTCC